MTISPAIPASSRPSLHHSTKSPTVSSSSAAGTTIESSGLSTSCAGNRRATSGSAAWAIRVWFPSWTCAKAARRLPCTSMTESADSVACRICSAATSDAGVVVGRVVPREFFLRRCPACGYGFVANPVADNGPIYDAAYYEGHGADPLVDYVGEVEYPAETIRLYE